MFKSLITAAVILFAAAIPAWALNKYSLDIVNLEGQKYLSASSVTVYRPGTTTAATLWNSNRGDTTITNPIVSGLSNGTIEFWGDFPYYDITIASSEDSAVSVKKNVKSTDSKIVFLATTDSNVTGRVGLDDMTEGGIAVKRGGSLVDGNAVDINNALGFLPQPVMTAANVSTLLNATPQDVNFNYLAVKGDVNLRTPILATGTVTYANLKLSTVAGTAWADFNTASILTAYANGTNYIIIKDNAGRKIEGFLKSASSGETVSANLLSNGTFDTDTSGWLATAGTIDVNTTAYSGKSMYLQRAGSPTAHFAYTSPAVTTIPGTVYKYSVYVHDGNKPNRAFSVKFADTNGAGGEISGTSSADWVQYYAYKRASLTSNFLTLYDSNTATGNILFDEANVAPVLTPANTGVRIVSTSAGTTYNWVAVDASFDYVDGNGYSYKIYSNAPTDTNLYSDGGFKFAKDGEVNGFSMVTAAEKARAANTHLLANEANYATAVSIANDYNSIKQIYFGGLGQPNFLKFGRILGDGSISSNTATNCTITNDRTKYKYGYQSININTNSDSAATARFDFPDFNVSVPSCGIGVWIEINDVNNVSKLAMRLWDACAPGAYYTTDIITDVSGYKGDDWLGIGSNLWTLLWLRGGGDDANGEFTASTSPAATAWGTTRAGRIFECNGISFEVTRKAGGADANFWIGEVIDFNSPAAAVIIGFDDAANSTIYDYVYPAISAYGWPWCLSIIPNNIQTGVAGYITKAQLHTIYDTGKVEFLSHTYTHNNYGTFPAEVNFLWVELNKSKRWLLANGFNVWGLSDPQLYIECNHVDPNYTGVYPIDLISKVYMTARGRTKLPDVNYNNQITYYSNARSSGKPNCWLTDMYNISSVSMESDYNDANLYVIPLLEKAYNNGHVVEFYAHKVGGTVVAGNSISESAFNSILAWIRNKEQAGGLIVITRTQWLDMVRGRFGAYRCGSDGQPYYEDFAGEARSLP